MTKREALIKYVKDIRKRHNVGTAENTYLPELLNFLRDALPEYEVYAHPKKDVKGLPDLAIREKDGAEDIGLTEAEALNVPLKKNLHGWEQAQDYAPQAPTILTNFHEFVVLDASGELGRYDISHADLTGNALTPTKVADAHLDGLSDVLELWATARGTLARPQKIARLLAFYARQALTALETQEASQVATIRRAMEEALGTSFSLPCPKAKGKRTAEQQRKDEAEWQKKQDHLDHFFRSSLVQALFYGLFSAWVMAARQGKAGAFTRDNAGDFLRVPVVNLLFDQLTPKQLGNLGMRQPLERAVSLLRRVDTEAFLKQFKEGHAVTYFYEPFLEAFDPELRKELGVWYTPPEIIEYQVRHVHELLKRHLNIPDGLLDKRVTILDPATGTGGYLLALGRFLQEEMQRRDTPFIGARLKEAFTTRIFGFELLPAPFTIAHLQLALLLQDAGGSLEDNERVGVLLTNSLIGWTPNGDKTVPVFPDLARERQEAEKIKQERQIMVMLGNPPYDRFAEMPDTKEEQDLIRPYKQCLRESWGVKKQLLDDLYIRFLRLAEWRVAENGQEGVVSFITNRSYLTGISHPVMREHLLRHFNHIYIDDLRGNQRAHKAGDGSVFTTETAGGIRVGAAIGSFVRQREPELDTTELAQVHYRAFHGSGATKRRELGENQKKYEPVFIPKRDQRYLLKPLKGEDVYWLWENVASILPVRFNDLQASRDDGPMDFYQASLVSKMVTYFDSSLSNEEVEKAYPYIMASGARFNAYEGRDTAIKNSEFIPDRIYQYSFRPFDNRFIYWQEYGKLLVEKRVEYWEQIDKNKFIIVNQVEEKSTNFDRIGFSNGLSEFHYLRPDSRAFPLRLQYKEFNHDIEYQYLPNISDFYDDLARVGLLKVPVSPPGSLCTPMPKPAPVLARYGEVRGPDNKPNALAWELAEEVFYHTLAVLSAPEYREEHAEYLAEDWPRVPMPQARKVLQESAALGRRVAALLDPQQQPELPKSLGQLVQAGTDKPATQALLGIGSKPQYDKAREVFVLSSELELAGVPLAVWEYTLGGYPVLKNWVNYRKDRKLTLDEAEWLQSIVKRIAALLALGSELDAVYQAAQH